MNDFIPPASGQVFNGSIKHRDLYLWDAWSYVAGDIIHLYSLAVSRKKPDGSELKAAERNDFPFHVRHFTSTDEGETWIDQGCFQKPGGAASGHDARNVWSGSIEPLANGEKLVGYTGLYDIGGDRNYLQNIALASSSDGYSLNAIADYPVCCPVRDRDLILSKGYYLDHPSRIGHDDGEEGGPIMTWRDPFIHRDEQDQIHLFWSAKSAPAHAVIAHGLLNETPEGYLLGSLLPPIDLPDGAEYTQAELPKIFRHTSTGCYYMVVSTCNRLYEGQSDEEVDKRMRLYKSDCIDGPWSFATPNGSTINGAEGLFGMTVLKTDFDNNRLLCMSPYTDAVAADMSLTFRAPFYLDLNTASVISS